MMKKWLASMGLLLLLNQPAVTAMDISPYKPGQLLTAEQAKELADRYASRKVQDWKPAPDKKTIEGKPDADLIGYGIQVLDKTIETIGPRVSDVNKRYSGNSLNCSSCHLKGADGLPGTKYYAIPFNNVVNDYPNFRARSMTIGTLQDRVNGCMVRSMGKGKPLPADSREMKGVLAYFAWLAEGTKKDMAMRGTGLPTAELPDRVADIDNGKLVFEKNCLACHGANGLGLKAPDYAETAKYTFPPLAGDDSFNDGAGMSRMIKATLFIHSNMPLGTSADKPALSIGDAYDVAGYVESLPRPGRVGREKDFPDPNFRPLDYPVPEYFKGDIEALNRAKYGPFTKVGKDK